MKNIKGNNMNQVSKLILQGTILTGLTLPTPASAGVLSTLETQCQCLIENATLGQLISLGVMLTLVIGIVAMKWVYRKKLKPSVPIEKLSEQKDPALQILRQLKIGARFSDWSDIRRLAENRQPTR